MWNAGSGLRKNFITFFCLPLLINISLRPLNCLSCFRAFHYIAFFLGRKLPELRLSYSYLKYHVWLKKFSMARNTIPRNFIAPWISRTSFSNSPSSRSCGTGTFGWSFFATIHESGIVSSGRRSTCLVPGYRKSTLCSVVTQSHAWFPPAHL